MALGCVLMMVVASFAATFPTADNHTLVASSGNGVVNVKATGETGWRMILYCQDNLRSGCGNNYAVKASQDVNGNMTFQIPADSIADGQIAFNFKKGDLWLLIPDCRVKTANQVRMGMSFKSNEIAESGGAHFVYTGGGILPWSPVDSGSWCDEKTSTSTAKVVTGVNRTGGGNDQGAVANASEQSAAAAHNSAAATNQSAAATNSSVANATSLINVNQVAGKGKKGGKNTAIVYAPNAKQNTDNRSFRGNSADVKVYANKGGKGGVKNVITYVAPSYQTIHFGVAGAETYDPYACAKCHSESAKEDARMKALVFKAMSCAASGACTDDDQHHKKGKK